jgi:hypothetical protein
MKYPEQLSVTMPQEEHRFLSAFLNLNVGKIRLKIMSVQVISPQVAQTETWRQFAKSSTNTDKASFWRPLAG